jgi:hypothetical protein
MKKSWLHVLFGLFIVSASLAFVGGGSEPAATPAEPPSATTRATPPATTPPPASTPAPAAK